MRIEIRKEDIVPRQSINIDCDGSICELCPVAVALTRAIGEQVRVTYLYRTPFRVQAVYYKVSESPVLLENAKKLPKEVSEWMDEYDNNHPVSPISFELEV